MVADAKKVIETDPDVGAHNVLVVGGDGWHRGVIGIAASKLVDAFHKPSIVLSIDGDEVHGSCRSIPAFDMLAALESCADLFVKFGGHRQAAGLTMERGKVKEFRKRINDWADARLEPDDLIPRLRVDGGLEFNDILSDVVEGIDALQPFGLGNPRPVFDAASVEIINGPHRLKDRHLDDERQTAWPRVPGHRVARRRARRVPPGTPPGRPARVFARQEHVPGRNVSRIERRRRAARLTFPDTVVVAAR